MDSQTHSNNDDGYFSRWRSVRTSVESRDTLEESFTVHTKPHSESMSSVEAFAVVHMP